MILEHLHANINGTNGNIYFDLKGKLVVMFVGTPEFNDSGEWILYEYKLLNESSENHKLLNLTPYNIEDIELKDTDYLTLDFFSKYPDYTTYPEYKDSLLRMIKEEDTYFILKEDKKIDITKWCYRKDLSENYGLYNIMIPILKGCIDSYSE